MTRYRQPWLHDLEIATRGNVTSLSDRLGDIAAPGTGVFVDDRRILSLWQMTVDGERPDWVASTSTGPHTRTVAVLRSWGDAGADPTVELHRHRELVEHGLRETVSVVSHATDRAEGQVVIDLGADGADIADVKAGGGGPRLAVSAGDGASVGWADGQHETTLLGSAGSPVVDATGARWVWDVTVEPGQVTRLDLTLTTVRRGDLTFPADAGWAVTHWDHVEVSATDPALGRLVGQSFEDLRGLLLTDPESPSDVFAGAGSPWYLTLFGRDSLWTGRFMLPFGTDLARGTLRALARRQGRQVDVGTAEAPGKILHEVRRTAYVDQVGGLSLPPVYFGSVDATPLWVRLLHDAWRWGLDEDTVRELRPHLDGALGWLKDQAEAGDGLLRYVDESGGSGLTNQGWKDSGDSMRRRDGSIAPAPIALVETQAYAVEAARGAAQLLEGVWGDDGTLWREWADDLAELVRQRFWVDGPVRYLAMAIDGGGGQVDGLGSNMGHVLGTGVLTEAEARRTAHVLTGPELLGAGGVGTLARDNPAYNPIGYHTGSVWTHDNAVAALGLAREGFRTEAARVVGALVEMAGRVDYRWPELYGGELLLGRPVPYPASCRPQAWAAASAGAVLEVALGVSADAPRGEITFAPVKPSPFGAMTVRGLRVGEVAVSVSISEEGEVLDVDAPGLDVVVR